MGRLLFEKLIVYSIAFIAIYSSSLVLVEKIQQKETKLTNVITSFIKDYNYEVQDVSIFSMDSNCELVYMEENNKVCFDYDMDVDGLKSLKVSVELYLKSNDDLSEVYNFLNYFTDDILEMYDAEINTMINSYLFTGERQKNENLLTDGSLWISNSYIDDTDYSLNFFNILKH